MTRALAAIALVLATGCGAPEPTVYPHAELDEICGPVASDGTILRLSIAPVDCAAAATRDVLELELGAADADTFEVAQGRRCRGEEDCVAVDRGTIRATGWDGRTLAFDGLEYDVVLEDGTIERGRVERTGLADCPPECPF